MTTGLWMLLVLALFVVGTGLPVWALLIGVATLFAGGGLAAGVFDAGILTALAPRIMNLLENDLLQALPLYVFIGVLLQRLALADALFSCAQRVFRPAGGAAAPLAGLAVGTLIAPMNGSVASSSSLLARLVAPRLAGVRPARAVALVSAAATIGVVVPPSLVLILLGDAMLRAHTEASNLPGYSLGQARIVNTQDVLHAALPPAALVLLLWALAAWVQHRRAPAGEETQLRASAAWLAGLTAIAIVLLLAGVFTGRLFAVEAAAAGGCALVAVTLATRALGAGEWEKVLRDTLSLSGALFALLIGATTFSLVFRIFGTDRWLAELILHSPWPAGLTAAGILLLVAACAWVLDAFEMIFVVIPIVAPLLIVQLGDAQQVAVLLLLVLQLSFLLPPLGYAVLMARARSGLPRVGTGRLLGALAPFIAGPLLAGALVFAWPRITHLLDAPAAPTNPAQPAPSEEEIVRQMEEMARQPPADGEPANKP
jgi:TRAP-type mannitol/chloroaromatic compound transport system permease large subunit